MKLKAALLVLVVAAALGVAACGGSSSNSASSTPASSSTPSSSTPASSSSQTSSTPKTSTTAFANATHCAALDGVGTQFEKAMEGATSGGSFNLNKAVAAYDGLANDAPAAIRPQVQVLAQAFTTFAAKLSAAGYKLGSTPSAKDLPVLESAIKAFESSKVKAAEASLEVWAKANCT